MRHLTLFTVFAISATLLYSCKKQTLTDIDFHTSYEQQVPVPAIQADSTRIFFSTVSMATNYQTNLDEYKAKKEHVDHIGMDIAFLRSLPQDAHYWEHYDTLQLYLSAAGLQEQLIGYLYDTDIAPDHGQLKLRTYPDNDLSKYYLQDTVYLRMYGHIKSAPPAITNIIVTPNFRILAKQV